MSEAGQLVTIEGDGARNAPPAKSSIVQHQTGGLIPQDIDQAWRLAQAVAGSGIAPRDYNGKPEAAMVAIMHGLEIGLKPMQAVQAIAVINGKPSVYGDGIVALVWGSGLCQELDEWHEGEGDDFGAVCETRRRGKVKSTKRKFTIADAKRAGLWEKSGPWKQYPNRMLQMRARAFCLRDAYADVLDGILVREEVEDYQDIPQARPEPDHVEAQIAEEQAAKQDEPLSQQPANVSRLPKNSIARELYTELQGDIDCLGTSESDLKDWAAKRASDIKELPQDWQEEIRTRYKNALLEARQHTAEHGEPYDNF